MLLFVYPDPASWSFCHCNFKKSFQYVSAFSHALHSQQLLLVMLIELNSRKISSPGLDGPIVILDRDSVSTEYHKGMRATASSCLALPTWAPGQSVSQGGPQSSLAERFCSRICRGKVCYRRPGSFTILTIETRKSPYTDHRLHLLLIVLLWSAVYAIALAVKCLLIFNLSDLHWVTKAHQTSKAMPCSAY